ncbi:glycosyltransferase family 4 protein [Aquimarina sp. ERC-38]|uniref:glycosyltransferase family 4 protein n=1 Tax=Aquimarina sp. ERC-38 TaxID=2949996 RepID=UPI0022484B98|nr:glycosyltransferase family 4 protein [Aquimarina sp. ERC-38]UZO80488.1 glycosyltransferase family 4 protein [Aquimarina sp. ERC-38]
MRVLHISGARGWGGNEQQLLYLSEELANRGVEQHLFGYQNSVLSQRLQEDIIRQHLIPYVKPYKKTYREALTNIVKHYRIDLIHLHTSDSVTGYVITDLFSNLKVKAVFSKKGISRKVSLLSKYKYNYKNIHKIICVSTIVKDHFKTVLVKKVHHKLCVVYDGVQQQEPNKVTTIKDLKKDLHLLQDIKIIGNIANHTDAKDLFTLLKTISYLTHELKITNIHLIQIGEFSRRTEELKRLIIKLNIEKYVSFLDFEKEAINYMSQFTVFVMTSQREGGPTTVLEAFSQKIPVVSTRVGVVAEAIENGNNGFIDNVGDYKGIANHIKSLIQDPFLRKEFADQSFNLFQEKFTREKLGLETLNIYKEVLSD